MATAPQVNSLSYGMTEVNVDKYLGKGYLARADFEFKKLALRGITIIIASGDTGAGDLGDEPMAVPNCNTLHADWPSQSAYVTSVSTLTSHIIILFHYYFYFLNLFHRLYDYYARGGAHLLPAGR
jgi:subtilase family serine protease